MHDTRAIATTRMWMRRWLLIALLALAMTASAQEWRFDDVDRVVAISDVHGDYDAMRTTLANAGVIDESLAWTGGTTHLVITGDLLDRGPDSRPVMDLLMKLEGEARSAGGAIHPLLGNHEVMNLAGDLRYVSREEFAAFAADEDAGEREGWLSRYRESEPGLTDEDALLAAFNDRYPPGFFAHRRAFRSDGEYGAWLLQKPVLVVINGTAFVHGGLSPRVAELGLEGINGGLVGELREYVASLEIVIDVGLLDPAENFYRHGTVLESIDASELDPDVAAAAARVIELGRSELHDQTSPLWYRGNVGCGPLVEHDRLGPALDRIGASRVVIGHTPTLTRQVLSRLNGKVIEIDTGMLNEYYQGSGNALVIEGDELSVVGEVPGGPRTVRAHPRRVGLRATGLSAPAIETLLAEGPVVAREESPEGRVILTVGEEGRQVRAVFVENPRGNGFVPELAAYRLDRFLELDMVPVTVAREIDGDEGVLQFLPDSTADETARRESGRGGSAWCPLPEQWSAMYVFDALIHNPGRAQDRMLYSLDNWQLILTGHDVSFATSRSRPSYLQDFPLVIGSYWQERLEALDADAVDELFAGSLDKRRRRALSARRDQLLKDARP
jgi:hypothetical protein